MWYNDNVNKKQRYTEYTTHTEENMAKRFKHGNPHMNSIRIVMEKDNDRKVLYLFSNGKARDMSNGFGELYNFGEIYKELKEAGYKNVNK